MEMKLRIFLLSLTLLIAGLQCSCGLVNHQIYRAKGLLHSAVRTVL